VGKRYNQIFLSASSFNTVYNMSMMRSVIYFSSLTIFKWSVQEGIQQTTLDISTLNSEDITFPLPDFPTT
jgi:hypothetical protein